ncbi:putative receptor-like protein kinase At3g47110 [Carex rostrata]
MRSSEMVVIINAVITFDVFMCFCLVVIILYQLRRTKRIGNLHTPASFKNGRYKKVSYADIAKATVGFSSKNLVGSGCFGSVYKGMLDNKAVAIKVFDLEQHEAPRSFNSECKPLRNMRHKNLVSVFTSCSSLDFKGNEFKSLLFEYIPNVSLDEGIHPKSPGKKLSLADGIYIAMDVASDPMVHRDIKPSSILIDTNMTALVSDFGLTRFLVASHSTSAEVSSTLHGLKGTIGYIPPEYASGSAISVRGDAYSYGIVLLEMLTGKRPTDAIFRDGFNIHAYVSNAFPEKIIEILNPSMFEELKCLESNLGNGNDLLNMVMEKCIIPLVRVSLACSKEAPKDRMRMVDVTVELSKIKQNPYLGSISLVF